PPPRLRRARSAPLPWGEGRFVAISNSHLSRRERGWGEGKKNRSAASPGQFIGRLRKIVPCGNDPEQRSGCPRSGQFQITREFIPGQQAQTRCLRLSRRERVGGEGKKNRSAGARYCLCHLPYRGAPALLSASSTIAPMSASFVG